MVPAVNAPPVFFESRRLKIGPKSAVMYTKNRIQSDDFGGIYEMSMKFHIHVPIGRT